MTFRSATAAIVVLAVATVWAQSTSPVTASGGAFASRIHAGAARSGMSPSAQYRMADWEGAATLRQRLEDMESTLNKMHALLKQMRTKDASSSSKDPLAKANLDMWELVLGHLDKQFDQLRAATLAREDLVRRTAMYKQAMDKADASGQHAQGQAMAAGTADQGTVSAGPAAAAATSGPNSPRHLHLPPPRQNSTSLSDGESNPAPPPWGIR